MRKLTVSYHEIFANVDIEGKLVKTVYLKILSKTDVSTRLYPKIPNSLQILTVTSLPRRLQ